MTAEITVADYGEFYAKSSDGIAQRSYKPFNSFTFTGLKFKEAKSEHFVLYYGDLLLNHYTTAANVLTDLEDAYKYGHLYDFGNQLDRI